MSETLPPPDPRDHELVRGDPELIERRWLELNAGSRARLLAEGKAHPSETDAEVRCRLMNEFGLMDEPQLAALMGVAESALVRWRVEGTGPVPIRVRRSIFYRRADVLDWIERHHDVHHEALGEKAAARQASDKSRRAKRAAA